MFFCVIGVDLYEQIINKEMVWALFIISLWGLLLLW
jgi:hypothetical protein